jgi:hypothetical protein
MGFALSMAVTIDIVAAVKEALQDLEVRDRIRTIVQEALPPPGDPVEGLVDAKVAATLLGMTPSAIRMAAYRGSLPYEKIGRRLRFRPSLLYRSRTKAQSRGAAPR